ncbi:hypothetical protein ACH5RR_033851 [Cinchona calisaya]|uniref:Uncharacterized protein n=1 Tax=Cinchona calisaya TaxID=153742 RepID=A0ABD2YDV0_9GENT
MARTPKFILALPSNSKAKGKVGKHSSITHDVDDDFTNSNLSKDGPIIDDTCDTIEVIDGVDHGNLLVVGVVSKVSSIVDRPLQETSTLNLHDHNNGTGTP